jgi:hypothetical protein
MATDDDVVTIDQMADRADGGKRPRGEHDPAQPDCLEQDPADMASEAVQPDRLAVVGALVPPL